METTSSYSKGVLGRSVKGLVTALALKTKVRSQKYKKSKYAIVNFSEKDLSEIIKEFEKIGKGGGRERSTYFCIGFSKIWREKIYNIIKNFVILTA